MLRKIIFGAAVSLAVAISLLGLTPLLASPVQAACTPGTLTAQSGIDCAKPDSAPKGALFGHGSIFNAVTNVLVFVVGAISVIMVIIGGLLYVLSSGDGKNTARAKDTILYAVIGLVVALFAYAIVNFVLTRVESAKGVIVVPVALEKL